MKRILLVEDTPEHARVAKLILSHSFEVTLATSYLDARILLKEEQFDGVITDLFMPTFSKEDTRYEKYEEVVPAGLGIASMATHRNIPAIICTDSHHHDANVEWIAQSAYELGIDFVDGLDEMPGMGKQKSWQWAGEQLVIKMK